MKVLGLDTSHYANAVGIVENGRVLADVNYDARSDSLVRIISNVEAALKEAGLKLGDIDGFGVGLGPGSWTGIRVGVTVGKMLAYSTGKPVCGIPTLEALAYGVGQKGPLVLAVIPAGTKDAVYAAAYQVKEGSIKRQGEYYVGDIGGLAGLIQGETCHSDPDLSGEESVSTMELRIHSVAALPQNDITRHAVVIVGAEADVYAEFLTAGKPIDIAGIRAVPRGSDIARIAAGRLERGEKDDTLALTPLYLKESTARVFQGKIT